MFDYPHLANLAATSRPASPSLGRPCQCQLAVGTGRRGNIELDRLKGLRQESVDLVPVPSRQPYLSPFLSTIDNAHAIGGGRIEAVILRAERRLVVRLGVVPPGPRARAAS